MTTVTIATAEDFQGDAVSTAREKDRILQVLDEHGDTHDMFRADEWLWDDKGLEALSKTETLVMARVVAETDDAWLISQNDEVENPGADDHHTDWVPKSVARRYVADEEEGVDPESSSQSFLTGWDQ